MSVPGPQPASATSPATPARKKTPSRYTILVWVLVFLLLTAVVTLGEWYRGVTGLQQPPGRPELAGGTDGLRTLIWTDRSGLGSSETTRLYVLCDNRTGGEIRDLRFLRFEAPSFERVEPCWNEGKPSCSVGPTGALQATGLPDRLAEGGTVLVAASLRARPLFGRHGASGLLAWTNAQGRTDQRAVILPGIEVHSEVLDWVSGMSKAIQVLALPVALVLLGGFLKRRDEKRKEDEASKQEWRIRLQETWNRELPKVIQNSSSYYMPAASAIESLLKRARGLKAESSDEDLQRCLYNLLRLLRRIAYLSSNIGGFYFKDLEGESLAGECWNLFEKASARRFKDADEDLARVLDTISPQISLAQYLDLVKGGREREKQQLAESLERLAECLRSWSAEAAFQEDLAALQVLALVFLFEMNRPMELWYGHLPPFPGSVFEATVDRLPALQAELKQRLGVYKRNCEVETARSLARWRASQKADWAEESG